MTALSTTQRFTPVKKNRNPVILFILCFLVLLAVLSTHAVEKHGAEAQRIRDCLSQNGPYMTFRGTGRNKDHYYFLCQLPSGEFGLRAALCEAGKLIEKTAFVKGDGTFSASLKYLTKFATKYTGDVPCQ